MNKKDIVVEKIIQLRKDYSEKYLSTGEIKSGKAFDVIHDKITKEIDEFRKSHNIAIDPRIVFVSDDDFDKYVDSGVIREFIIHGDLNLM